MKKTILKSVLVALVITTSFISCSSDPAVSKPPPIGLGEFFYRHNGILAYSTVSNSFVSASNNIIYAENGSFNVIKIPLSSLSVGTYFIGGINQFYYNNPFYLNTWIAYDGYIKITNVSAGTITGIFKVAGSGFKGVTSVNGYFNEVPILP